MLLGIAAGLKGFGGPTGCNSGKSSSSISGIGTAAAAACAAACSAASMDLLPVGTGVCSYPPRLLSLTPTTPKSWAPRNAVENEAQEPNKTCH